MYKNRRYTITIKKNPAKSDISESFSPSGEIVSLKMDDDGTADGQGRKKKR